MRQQKEGKQIKVLIKNLESDSLNWMNGIWMSILMNLSCVSLIVYMLYGLADYRGREREWKRDRVRAFRTFSKRLTTTTTTTATTAAAQHTMKIRLNALRYKCGEMCVYAECVWASVHLCVCMRCVCAACACVRVCNSSCFYYFWFCFLFFFFLHTLPLRKSKNESPEFCACFKFIFCFSKWFCDHSISSQCSNAKEECEEGVVKRATYGRGVVCKAVECRFLYVHVLRRTENTTIRDSFVCFLLKLLSL